MSFSSLGLSEPILRAVSERGYTQPTPIQLQAIPAVLSGGDLLAGAQTGTGKTAGFTLPILERLSARPVARNGKAAPIRALVLTPTRELAAQVEESVAEYGKYVDLHSMSIFGGVAINPQIAGLKKGVDILVATPGRLLDHAQQRTVDLSSVEILVLDEADRMLDMGFIHDIKRVLALLPKQRQNLLFSATFSDEIKTLADGLLNRPALIEVARRNAPAEGVEQRVMLVEQKAKAALLAHLVKEHAWFQVLVFTRTKHRANWLAERLNKDGIPALAIHGNKSQGARTRALAQFKAGTLQVLCATDIAARGLDIVDLPHVVNFEIPNVPHDYVHRIGRTGRAGASGEAISLVSKDELPFLADIEKLIKRRLPRETVVGFDTVGEEPPPERGRRQPQARQAVARGAAPGKEGNKPRNVGHGGNPAGSKPARAGGKGQGPAPGKRREDQAVVRQQRPSQVKSEVNGNVMPLGKPDPNGNRPEPRHVQEGNKPARTGKQGMPSQPRRNGEKSIRQQGKAAQASTATTQSQRADAAKKPSGFKGALSRGFNALRRFGG